MFVELIYDKRNFAGLPGAREAILNELTKRMQRIFPEAEVRVKPMMTLPAINTDASKHEKELISRTVQEMFEEADMWLTEEGSRPSVAATTSLRAFPDVAEPRATVQ